MREFDGTKREYFSKNELQLFESGEEHIKRRRRKELLSAASERCHQSLLAMPPVGASIATRCTDCKRQKTSALSVVNRDNHLPLLLKFEIKTHPSLNPSFFAGLPSDLSP